MNNYLYYLTIIAIIQIYAITDISAEQRFVTGKLTHDGQQKFESSATVRIELQDTSLMDSSAKIIGWTTLNGVNSFPVFYKIPFDSKSVIPGNRYSVSAQIVRADGRILYINDAYIGIDSLENPVSELNVPLIRIQDKDPDLFLPLTEENPCRPMLCRGSKPICPYGFQTKDGCEICQCFDPCNPPGQRLSCGVNRQCYVVKTNNGKFEPRCKNPAIKESVQQQTTTNKMICGQPKVVGYCRAALSRFHYNPATNSCEEFTYGGCDGSQNNFHSKEDCEKMCKI